MWENNDNAINKLEFIFPCRQIIVFRPLHRISSSRDAAGLQERVWE
jgi:hypothetical protein